MNTTYCIETTDFKIREKIFKHQYGGSPYNVARFLIFARNTSAVRTNLTNKRSTKNAGNGISGLQISKFSGEECHPLWKTSSNKSGGKCPRTLTNQARSAPELTSMQYSAN